MKTYKKFINEGINSNRKFINDIFSNAYDKAIKKLIKLHETITEEHIIELINLYTNNYYGIQFPVSSTEYKYIKSLVHKKLLKKNEQLNESYELSGKHSFLTFLQIISNHDYHFIMNKHYTELYNYHFFFSTETIKDNDKFIEIFKYKHSLPAAYQFLLDIKEQKLSFFFGIKDDSVLRYGFVDLDSQRSYVIGEFNVTGTYFSSISKYKALQFVNKVLQNTDVKSLPVLSKVKKDFEKFYSSKKSLKIRIIDNKVINYFDKSEFSDDDFQMNRPFRILDQWVSKRAWRNKVECSVDDTKDPIEFIIIVK